MPSSPRCYLGHPSVESTVKLDIAMTSCGLQIPLLMLPLELKCSLQGPGIHGAATFAFSELSCAEDIRIDVKMLDQGKLKMEYHDWALGLFNYIAPNSISMGHPGLRRSSVGYLLGRLKPPRGQRQLANREGQILEEKQTHRWIFSVQKWEKLSTTKAIHVTFKSIPEGGSMVVDKKRLEVLHL
ncbi:hypothetical protein QBC40DRAFT_274288 [Triangularia verruculosa]|uniref:Uncharacterized protein n=1 Tax=Triangularia verruculosa TaxID=2587418 RepID=A0AAN6XQT2_9PEZI|nr:hypothetical protein QBC40DRAFT_274288 [Triangularia verruculosa]